MRSTSSRVLSGLLLVVSAVGCSDGGSDEQPGEDLPGCPGEVDVPDRALARELRAELGIGDAEPIAGEALAEILTLDASNAGIESLHGIECASALYLVHLDGNRITDVSPLAELDGLEQLYIGQNAIRDVSPLSLVESLEVLHLESNQVSDLSPLRGHARLHTLKAGDNAITSTANIADMPTLATLDLANNPISSLEGLTGLPSLFYLGLGGTMIADLGALAAVPQIDNLHVERAALTSLDSLPDLRLLTWIDASHNVLTDVAALARPGFPSLQRVTLDGNPLDGVESVAAIGVAYEISINDIGVADLGPLSVESSLRSVPRRGRLRLTAQVLSSATYGCRPRPRSTSA